MQFMFFVCTDKQAEDYVPAEDNIEQWVAEMDGRGVRAGGDMLWSPSKAVMVKRRGGELLVTDGPFAETKESIAGYDLIDCANLEEAIEIASAHPMSRFGQIEIRPVRKFE